jgi:hypothetical protein
VHDAPYSNFPFERALSGIAKAGYPYVAWGTRHRDASGERRDVIEVASPAAKAKELAGQCRDAGLKPVMMFSTVYVGAENSVTAHTSRTAAGLSLVCS